MMKKLFSIFILLFIVSCHDSRNDSQIHTLDFRAFTIDVPKSWKRIEVQGIDSYVGAIAIDNADTLHFDIGLWSNSLTEPGPIILKRSEFDGLGLDTTEVVLVDKINLVDPDNYKRQALT